MPKKRVHLHARRRVAKEFTRAELDRLLREAVAAAERSRGWAAGKEYEYPIEDEPYVLDGIENSTLTVCHMGTRYEVYYYDGVTGELFT
jgi:hypothetical protein